MVLPTERHAAETYPRRTLLSFLVVGLSSVGAATVVDRPRPAKPGDQVNQPSRYSVGRGPTVRAIDHGVVANGLTDDTQALSRAARLAGGGVLILPRGVISTSGLSIPPHTKVLGAGLEHTTLRLRPSSTVEALLRNDVGSTGSAGIWLEDFSIDGNERAQSKAIHGAWMDRVTDGFFAIGCENANGSGFLLTNSSGNRFGDKMICRGNGRRSPGYGLYIANSSDNQVDQGRYEDNCIGLAIESIGNGQSRRNRVLNVLCANNRADFGQSGAGVHLEQTAGNDCDDCILIDPTCYGSTGVGINNTGTNVVIQGGNIHDNRESGLATISAVGFRYSRLTLRNNAIGKSNGYKAEMRFDDTNVALASTGVVENCSLSGRAPDGGLKAMSKKTKINLLGNKFAGYARNITP